MKQTHKLLFICMIALINGVYMFASTCKNTCCSTKKVAYIELKNYFVNNNAPSKMPEKFTSEKQLYRYFSEAAYMGRGGEPTRVNFKTHFVVPLILPETERETTIKVKDVRIEHDKTLVITYKIKSKELRTFSIRPMMSIVLEKKYKRFKIKKVML